MSFVQNVPCFSCIFPMIAAFITAALARHEKAARRVTIGLVLLVAAMSAWLLSYLVGTGESYVYVMGQFAAPWGNELRAGMLEALIALLFSGIMLVSLLGGMDDYGTDLYEGKANLFYIMVDLMLAANLALVYTNDMFTAYVFVEISTISACGLIIGRDHDFSVAAGVRYMVMSLMGSGLLLFGICFLYDATGHLLMESTHNYIVSVMWADGQYMVPLIMSLGMILTGLCIKSGLWPFHSWMPQAYGHSTTTASGILSSITSKGYIILAMKFIFRVYDLETVLPTHMLDVFLVLGIIAMMAGSIKAIFQSNIRKLVAYSSVAQIGYIYMGLGMGTSEGACGALYHILAHSCAKTLVFISIAGLIKVSAGKKNLEKDLLGAGFRNPVAAIGYVAGTLSMIGIPGFAGFISKFMLATAALKQTDVKMIFILGALAISTLLNAIYFMRVMIRIFTPPAHLIGHGGGHHTASAKQTAPAAPYRNSACYCVAIGICVVAILYLGLCSDSVMSIIENGFGLFV